MRLLGPLVLIMVVVSGPAIIVAVEFQRRAQAEEALEFLVRKSLEEEAHPFTFGG